MLKLKASHEYDHAYPSHQSDLGPLSFSKISNVDLIQEKFGCLHLITCFNLKLAMNMAMPILATKVTFDH